MIRILSVLAMLVASPVLAQDARQPDYFKAYNAIRSMEDIYSGLDAQSYEAHRQFVAALSEIVERRTFPLRLVDDVEIYRISTFAYIQGRENFLLEFQDKGCIDPTVVWRRFGMQPAITSHSPITWAVMNAHVFTRMDADRCVRSLQLTMAEEMNRPGERMLLDGSVSRADLESLVQRVNAAGKDPSRYRVPLQQLWRSQGSRHVDAVTVLKSIRSQSGNSYSYYLGADSCVDAAPFLAAEEADGKQWSVEKRPTNPICLKAFRYSDRAGR